MVQRLLHRNHILVQVLISSAICFKGGFFLRGNACASLHPFMIKNYIK